MGTNGALALRSLRGATGWTSQLRLCVGIAQRIEVDAAIAAALGVPTKFLYGPSAGPSALWRMGQTDVRLDEKEYRVGGVLRGSCYRVWTSHGEVSRAASLAELLWALRLFWQYATATGRRGR